MEKEVADLKRDKENSDIATEKLEKEVVKLKRRENLANKLAVNEFKASVEYKEAVEKEDSSYFGEGFELCKKQVSLRFPDIDIEDMHIDPDRAE